MERPEIHLESSIWDVRRALSTVYDPELDEAVTELGFIQEVAVDKSGDVSVSFHLPTYWCSANFAFLMASDMRDAIAEIPWVGKITIRLTDHFTSAEISAGASSGKSFQESFEMEPDQDLEDIRFIFRRKSFQKRQEMLLRYLLDRNETIPDLLRMSLSELNLLCLDVAGSTFRARYLQARTTLGFSSLSSGPVFHDEEGRRLNPEEFDDYLRQLRRVRLNTEFNAAICRGLLEVRHGVRHRDGLVQIKSVVSAEVKPSQ